MNVFPSSTRVTRTPTAADRLAYFLRDNGGVLLIAVLLVAGSYATAGVGNWLFGAVKDRTVQTYVAQS